MTRSFCILLLASITFSIFGQSLQVDTITIYSYSQTSRGLVTLIDGKLSSQKKLAELEKCDSVWASDTTLRFVELKDLKGRLKKTFYTKGIESPYFGEYKEYYTNGKVKIHGYHTLPFKIKTDSIRTVHSESYPDGKWTFYAKNGKMVMVKSYKEGIANGEWTLFDNKERKIIVKRFVNGKSNGEWMNYIYHNKNSSTGHGKDFQMGVQISDCNSCFFDFKSDEFEHQVGSSYPIKAYNNCVVGRYSESLLEDGQFYFLKDGVIIKLREFSKGEIINEINYDYR